MTILMMRSGISFSVNANVGILLQAHKEGYEHLTRYFLKLSRTEKNKGFHSHHALELGEESHSEPELSILIGETLRLEAVEKFRSAYPSSF